MPAPTCPKQLAVTANTLSELRSVISFCAEYADTYDLALAKLSKLPLPTSSQLELRAPNVGARKLQVTFETEIYFYVFDPYPSDEAFEKLAAFVKELNKTFSIKSVQIRGGTDAFERSLKSADQLATQRATLIHEYLIAAGLNKSVPISIFKREPSNEDTKEGRARDRVAEIVVIALRNDPSSQ